MGSTVEREDGLVSGDLYVLNTTSEVVCETDCSDSECANTSLTLR